MGSWGAGLFADDLACDLRDEFRDLLGDGLAAGEAVARLRAKYADSLDDPDEAPVFWLALAATQWKLGHVDEETQREALRVIDTGEDLARWSEDGGESRERRKVLEKLREQLASPPPAPKKIAKRRVAENDWEVGEVVGLRLASGRWTLMRVLGHFRDRGGAFPRCEMLDWTGEQIPSRAEIDALPLRPERDASSTSRFILDEPKRAHLARLQRTGVISTPSQPSQGGFFLAWEHLDRQLKEAFRLE